MAKKGDYVEIVKIILLSKDRAEHIPEDTKNVDYKMWVRGFLLKDANIGDEVQIETILGRKIYGVLESEWPHYNHSFGYLIPEIFEIRKTIKKELS